MTDTGAFGDRWRAGFVPNANPGAAFGEMFEGDGFLRPAPHFPRVLSPDEIRHCRKAAKKTQAALADALGVARRTVEGWEAGNRTPPAYLALALVALGWLRRPR